MKRSFCFANTKGLSTMPLYLVFRQHPVNNFKNMLFTYRCQLCASWSHGHSSYYVLHFINQYLEINLKNSHEGILHFLSAKCGYNYLVELGAIGLQDKPLYNHNQKKSSPSLSSQSIEIRFNNPSIFNWTMAFRGVGVALK